MRDKMRTLDEVEATGKFDPWEINAVRNFIGDATPPAIMSPEENRQRIMSAKGVMQSVDFAIMEYFPNLKLNKINAKSERLYNPETDIAKWYVDIAIDKASIKFDITDNFKWAEYNGHKLSRILFARIIKGIRKFMKAREL